MVAILFVSVPALDSDCSDLKTVEHERMYVAAHLPLLEYVLLYNSYYYIVCNTAAIS